MSFAVITHNTE